MDVDNTPDIEQIIADTELSTNTEIPMEGTAPPEREAQAPTPQEYEFDYSGQKIKAPIEKVLKWASMGYGAPNRIGELQKQLNDQSGRLKTYEKFDQTYGQIDQWAAQNPEKWKALFDGWRAAQFGADPAQVSNPEQMRATLPPEVLQELQASRQWREQQIQNEQTQKVQRADSNLDKEILSIRKQYSNLDFDAPNETGKSLEYQILQHGIQNGIPSFRAAFRDYCFDKLGNISESKGREQGSKAMAPKTKAALLGKDPAASTRGDRPVTEFLKTRNYDQIHEHILQEMGLRSS